MNFISIELLTALFLLVVGMATNVFMGTLEANYTGRWSKEIMLRGVYKACVIFIGIFVVSFASSIDETIVFAGTPIVEYIHNAVIIAYVYYYTQVATKILKFISVPTVEDKEEEI